MEIPHWQLSTNASGTTLHSRNIPLFFSGIVNFFQEMMFLSFFFVSFLQVIYTDHLDVPRGCIVDHTIDYSLPRACFVHEMDFYTIVAVDNLDNGFGKRPVSYSN